MKRILDTLGILALASLAACGGGGDGGSSDGGPAAKPEGVYAGTLTGAEWPNYEMLVLEDGSYWALYGQEAGGLFYFTGGFVQGHGTSSGNTFHSADARDFGVAPAAAGSVDATFDATKGTMAGTISGAAGTVQFTGGRPIDNSYVYANPAALSSVTGDWTLGDNTGDTENIRVAADGSFTGTSASGCSFTGRIAPRASGKNVFDVTFTFGGAPCLLAGQPASGIGLEYPADATTNQFMVTVTDGSRQYGIMALGQRASSGH